MKELDNSKGATPLYLQISAILKEKILKEEYAYGDIIPSEKELENMYHVSRITARQAIQELEKEHMVERGRGKGTIVTYRNCIEEYLNTIRSFTDEMKERNIEPGTKNARISIVQSNREQAQIFGIETGTLLYYLERVRTGDGKEIVYFESYFPMDANLPMDKEVYDGSVYVLLRERGILPVHVKEQFDCLLPSEIVQEKLDIMRENPVLRRRRISYSESGKVVEYTIGHYRGDRYAYQVEMDLYR